MFEGHVTPVRGDYRYHRNMFAGYATPSGTARFAGRFPAQQAAGFYRDAQGLLVSNIGIGTYLGDIDEATDRGYTEAIRAALKEGVNFIDTSLNYRNQRSELAIGAALAGAEPARPNPRYED